MNSTAERIIRVLLDQARCTECGSAYHAEDVHVLRQFDDRVWDLAVVCNGCYTLSLIRAIVKPTDVGVPAGNAEVQVRTVNEMTRAERRYFSDLPPVEADDVLDVSAFLAAFDGDFRELFRQDRVDPAHG